MIRGLDGLTRGGLFIKQRKMFETFEMSDPIETSRLTAPFFSPFSTSSLGDSPLSFSLDKYLTLGDNPFILIFFSFYLGHSTCSLTFSLSSSTLGGSQYLSEKLHHLARWCSRRASARCLEMVTSFMYHPARQRFIFEISRLLFTGSILDMLYHIVVRVNMKLGRCRVVYIEERE